MESNEKEKVVYEQPTTKLRRDEIAKTCCSTLKLTMPCVVDTIDNAVDEAYAGWPERLFVIGADGRVAYAGGQGPFGFKPEEVQLWLSKHLKDQVARRLSD